VIDGIFATADNKLVELGRYLTQKVCHTKP
jgi:hypothetical protein